MTKTIFLWVTIMGTLTGFSAEKSLTLTQALVLAEKNSPELRAAKLYVQSAKKSINAAGLWLNPTVEMTAENIGFDNDLFSQGEYTVGVEQEFQRGQKQKLDRTVATKVLSVEKQTFFKKRLRLHEQISRSFFEVIAENKMVAIRTEQVKLASRFVEVAKQRYKSGGNSELDLIQAELALAETVILKTTEESTLKAKQELLASFIGISVTNLPALNETFEQLGSVKDFTLSDSHPSLQYLTAEVAKMQSMARRARAEDSANISAGAGYRYDADSERNTFLVSLSMPLSFSKRGRTEEAAGLLKANAIRAEYDETYRQLQQELTLLRIQYNAKKMQAKRVKTTLIPKAERAYEVSQKGYKLGRFSWVELIAAQQALVRVRINYINYLRDAHLLRAQLLKFKPEGK